MDCWASWSWLPLPGCSPAAAAASFSASSSSLCLPRPRRAGPLRKLPGTLLTRRTRIEPCRAGLSSGRTPARDEARRETLPRFAATALSRATVWGASSGTSLLLSTTSGWAWDREAWDERCECEAESDL